MKRTKKKDKSGIPPGKSKYALKRAKQLEAERSPQALADMWSGHNDQARKSAAFAETPSRNGREVGHVFPKG